MTEYFKLKHPITSLIKIEQGKYYKVSVFINHQCAGFLNVLPEEWSEFVQVFRRQEASAMSVSIGNGKTSCLWTDQGEIDYDMPLISEYGEITTFRQLQHE